MGPAEVGGRKSKLSDTIVVSKLVELNGMLFALRQT